MGTEIVVSQNAFAVDFHSHVPGLIGLSSKNSPGIGSLSTSSKVSPLSLRSVSNVAQSSFGIGSATSPFTAHGGIGPASTIVNIGVSANASGALSSTCGVPEFRIFERRNSFTKTVTKVRTALEGDTEMSCNDKLKVVNPFFSQHASELDDLHLNPASPSVLLWSKRPDGVSSPSVKPAYLKSNEMPARRHTFVEDGVSQSRFVFAFFRSLFIQSGSSPNPLSLANTLNAHDLFRKQSASSEVSPNVLQNNRVVSIKNKAHQLPPRHQSFSNASNSHKNLFSNNVIQSLSSPTLSPDMTQRRISRGISVPTPISLPRAVSMDLSDEDDKQIRLAEESVCFSIYFILM